MKVPGASPCESVEICAQSQSRRLPPCSLSLFHDRLDRALIMPAAAGKPESMQTNSIDGSEQEERDKN